MFTAPAPPGLRVAPRAPTHERGLTVIDFRHIGSTLEDFLREENRLEKARAIAIKRVLAWQIEQAMQAQQLTKTEMARRQAALLRSAPEEREALDFIEAAADFEDWTP